MKTNVIEKAPAAGKKKAARGARQRARVEQGINPALLVTVEEACGMLSIGPKVLYRLMSRGEIAYRHLGRYRRIPVWSLEEFAGVPPDRRRTAAGTA